MYNIKIENNIRGRQTGKTSTIIKNCKKDDLIIVNSNKCINFVNLQFNIIGINKSERPKIITHTSLIPDSIHKINTVWIDEYDFMNKSSIYNKLFLENENNRYLNIQKIITYSTTKLLRDKELWKSLKIVLDRYDSNFIRNNLLNIQTKCLYLMKGSTLNIETTEKYNSEKHLTDYQIQQYSGEFYINK